MCIWCWQSYRGSGEHLCPGLAFLKGVAQIDRLTICLASSNLVTGKPFHFRSVPGTVTHWGTDYDVIWWQTNTIPSSLSSTQSGPVCSVGLSGWPFLYILLLYTCSMTMTGLHFDPRSVCCVSSGLCEACSTDHRYCSFLFFIIVLRLEPRVHTPIKIWAQVTVFYMDLEVEICDLFYSPGR